MTESWKQLRLDDVRRDCRAELHAAPLDPKLADGDAELAGRLIGRRPDRGREGAAWDLDVTTASLVRVDDDQLECTVWLRYRCRGDPAELRPGQCRRPATPRCASGRHEWSTG